ncbi:MAG: hypothetical protein AAFO81_06905 [Pseudomonadota bacterium]
MSIDYGIEWAYGEFRIAKLRAGQVVESWKSPTPVTDLKSLSVAMHEAVHHIDISRGGSVAIAYEDDLHTHEFLEIPPLSKRDLQKFLQRHVDQGKPFDGPAAWRAHPVARGGVNGVLLHLMPKYILDAVMRICEDLYLLPKLLVPLTEIMSEFVPSIGIEDDRALLLIALFDDRTQMLISSDDGEILFVRELSYPWTPQTNGRLVLDINRTIGYARQRIGGNIRQAWLLGERAPQASKVLDEKVDAQIQYDARAAEPEFWMRQVAALPQALSSNFIPLLSRRSISGKTLVRTAVLMSAVTAVASLVVAAMIELTIISHRFDNEWTAARTAETRAALSALQDEVALMELESNKLDILNVDAFNLPALFLSHLGDMVPPGLVLTEAAVTHDSQDWVVTLRGHSVVPLGDLAPLLAQFQSRMEGEPWNTVIDTSWEQAWMQQLQQGMASQSGDVGFEIVGNLR